MPTILNICFKSKMAILFVLAALLFLASFRPSPSIACSFPPRCTSVCIDTIDKTSRTDWDGYEQLIRDTLYNLKRTRVKALKAGRKNKWNESERLFGVDSLTARIVSLENTLINLTQLRESKQTYLIGRIDKDFSSMGQTLYDSATKIVVFYVGDAENFVHETTHGGQFQRLQFGFIKDHNLKQYLSFCDDAADEIAAYKAQFAFDPGYVTQLRSSSTANSFETITIPWLKALKDNSGNYVYADTSSIHLARIPVTFYSPKDSLIKAYPKNEIIEKLTDSNPIISNPLFIHY
jgi:hypothetical protein